MPEADQGARKLLRNRSPEGAFPRRARSQPRAVAAARMKHLVVLRIADDADLATSVLDVSDRYAVVASAAQKIVRAVDRIDDPDTLGRAGELRRGFLTEKCIAGKLAPSSARISSSTARSATLTKSCAPLASTTSVPRSVK